MRCPASRRNRTDRAEVKMTPMIDVIFLLLIFFVCTASFQRIEHVLPTRLSLLGDTPTDIPIEPELIDLDKIVVEILWRDAQPSWRINQRECQRLTEVGTVLQAARSLEADLPVILDPQPAVPMEHVIDLYDLCRQVGLQRVRFAASADL